MKNKKLFLLCGCPGSGKSTWARQRINTHGGYHISRDEIRFTLLDERGGNYFDYEKYGRDARLNGVYIADNNIAIL